MSSNSQVLVMAHSTVQVFSVHSTRIVCVQTGQSCSAHLSEPRIFLNAVDLDVNNRSVKARSGG